MTTIKLPARCDRAAAEALFPEFVAAMGSGATEVDGSAVTQIGQSVLQLLVSARRSGNGATITRSDALTKAAEMTGLTGELFDGDKA
ncbi:hypothetical protein B2G71_10920 [Novosphingobium sp. PC22D]|uniref:STAS domain-containing protein n=1 Tax=Novosphingobium sp. PC22D TaxID=1962403 RepID=UPI000BF1182C|nr:STAS domain-containing protein [Novosphingobium sp. PC22D]PEQ12795.1 hypothetical protein B2G71_10920 [Novosphingobium sp. PC22D]